jgi:hypothetical protein
MRLALLFALLAAPALAAVPEKGEGTLTVLPGARYIFGNSAYLNEQGGSHRALQPGVIGSFGYQYDDELHFKIDLGYLIDSYSDGLQVRSIPILIGMDTALLRRSWCTVYGGGGIGYSLNTGTRSGATQEANSTAGFLQVGWRIALASKVALVIEDRYTLASAQVDFPTSAQSLNVGGNFFSVGLMLHFLEPDDKGHPQAPPSR